jgi:tRNA threonylcarbamoyl adenosine modification protein YeaZ
MLIIAFDTASAICAACVFDAGTEIVLAQASEDIGTGHAERLMPMIGDVLAAAGVTLADIGLIGCSVGPGSFTGVRVGVAAARGFAQALHVPLAAITTLDAIAAAALPLAQGRPVRVMIDARRGEVHTQDFAADGTALSAPALLSHAAAASGADGFVLAGSGAGVVLPDRKIVLPDAATGAIADFARLAALSASQSRTSLTISPLYLRGADAKPQEDFALARSGATGE